MEALEDRKPPPRQLIPQNSYKFPLSRSGKNSVKNSWIPIMIRMSTEIGRFVASDTSHHSKLLLRIRRQLLELIAKFVELPLFRSGKNYF